MTLQPQSESSGAPTTSEASCRQIDLADSLRLTKRQKLDRDLCKAVLYQGNCSHGMLTENRHWKAVIQGLANDAGLQGYVPPSRYKISNELLDYHYVELKNKVDQRLRNSDPNAPATTVTVTFDGWDNAGKTHVLGVVAITRNGPLFSKAIDTTGVELQGKDWTLEKIKEVVADHGGPEVVGAVVLDSPSVNKAALQAYEQEQSTVACLLCTCHVISLFLKDVFKKLTCFRDASYIINQISKKFRSVKWLKDQLLEKQTTLPLKVRFLAVLCYADSLWCS